MDKNDDAQKILMISNQGSYSHIQTHIYYVSRILRSKDVRLSILVPENGNWVTKMKDSGYNVEIIKFGKRCLKSCYDLYQFFKKNEFDVIHSHSTSLIWVLAAKLANKKTILLHTYHSGLKISVNGIFEKIALKLLNKIITITLNQQKNLLPFHINVKKMEHIPYGISERFYINNMPYKRSKYRKMFRIRERGFVIGTVGKFGKKSGFKYLLDSLNLIKNDFEFTCVFVGDGPNKDEIIQLINQYKLQKKVKLLGYCDRIYDVIPAFDILLIPYITEDYSIIPLEAMASGVPVIAFQQPYLSELSDEFESIFLTPNKDATGFAHQIKELRGKKSQVNDMSLSSYLRSQNYHQELMMEKLAELYQVDIKEENNKPKKKYFNYKKKWEK